MTVADIKAALRIEVDAEDALIADWIQSEREWIEGYLNLALVEQTIVAKMDCFPAAGSFRLPMSNLISVTSITYIDVDGDEQTLATSVYDIDKTVNPGLVFLKYDQEWPSTRAQRDAVTVTYKAGYEHSGASPTDLTDRIPRRVLSALILMVGDRYENRQARDPMQLHKNPAAIDLLYPIRVHPV